MMRLRELGMMLGGLDLYQAARVAGISDATARENPVIGLDFAADILGTDSTRATILIGKYRHGVQFARMKGEHGKRLGEFIGALKKPPKVQFEVEGLGSFYNEADLQAAAKKMVAAMAKAEADEESAMNRQMKAAMMTGDSWRKKNRFTFGGAAAPKRAPPAGWNADTFYQGNRCPHGHPGIRYKSNNRCVHCQRMANKAALAAKKEKTT